MASPEFDGTFNHPHTNSLPNGNSYTRNAKEVETDGV